MVVVIYCHVAEELGGDLLLCLCGLGFSYISAESSLLLEDWGQGCLDLKTKKTCLVANLWGAESLVI